MKKLIKEPLLHFLCIGALVFILFSVVNQEENPVGGSRVVITTADIARLSNAWSKKMKRPPTRVELQGLIEAHIKEEVYYREALALGLDKNDTILRRRLMQKMEFLTNDLADLNQPDETDLSRYFSENQDKYKLPARISFVHIYFSIDKRGANAVEDSKRLLSMLDERSAPGRGDRFIMGNDFVRETLSGVTRIFGSSFTKQLFTLETNTWQGPVRSTYGFHLVWINEKIAPRIPELATVVDKVSMDWMFEQRQKANKEVYERFKERYEIVVEDVAEQPPKAKAVGSNGRAS